MAGPRGWILGPRHASIQARNAGVQGGLGLVEDGQFFLRRPLCPGLLRLVKKPDGLALCGVAIAVHRHPVAHVLSKEFDPLMQPPLVQQPGLMVEELLYLTYDLCAHTSSSLGKAPHPPPATLGAAYRCCAPL